MAAGTFPLRERLRQRKRFQRIFQQGERVESRSFLLLWHRGGGIRQAGFTLSRHLRGAVRRNRARRRVREAYRLSRLVLLPQGIQVVFVVRRGALTVKFSELLREVKEGLEAVSDRASMDK